MVTLRCVLPVIILCWSGMFLFELFVIEDDRPVSAVVDTSNNHLVTDDSRLPVNSAVLLTRTRLERDLATGMQTCPTTRRPPPADSLRTNNSSWQRQKDASNNTLVVYSAFYDDRPAVGVTPWIRIQGVASLVNKTDTTLFCHVWFDACLAPYVTTTVVNVAGRASGYVIDNVRYVQYMFSCRLPGTDPIPSHVSLVATERCSSSCIYLPVVRPIRSEPDHEFGVCVAIAFGSVPVAEFVEWIELNRMFGVTEFNIYDAGMVNMSKVFRYYVRQGVLKIHHMPPPVPSVTSSNKKDKIVTRSASYNAVKLASTASLNDCQIRNVYRYRYVVVIDFDEVIVPRFHANYSRMLEYIKRYHKLSQSASSYIFANTYFFIDFQPDAKQPKHMRTARFRLHTAPDDYKIGPKSFVDPRHCLVAFNHFCLRPISTSLGPPVQYVRPSIARSHHYRRCNFVMSNNITACDNYSNATRFVDFRILRFKRTLQPVVERVLALLAG